MTQTILNVDGMSCEHCVKAVEGAVSPLPGVESVFVDLTAGTVAVDYDPSQTPLETIKDEIESQGFDVR